MSNLKKSSKRDYYKTLFMPLNGKASNGFDIFGFDVESVHVKDNFKRRSGDSVDCWRQEFLMGSVVGSNGVKVFWDRKKMGKHLLNRMYMGNMLMATNLEFDFNMLYYDDLDKFNLIYNNGLIAASYRERTGKDDKERCRKWTFTDTMNYMRCSLASLGEIVGIPKMDKPSTMKPGNGLELFSRYPEDEQERQEIIDYNVNDSLITYKFGEMFKDFCTKHNMKMKLTIGSTGMDFWRRNYQKAPLKREPDDMVMKHFQGSFKGGATQTFKRGTYPLIGTHEDNGVNMWYFDYRSAYPAVMVDGIDGKGNYPDPSSYVYRKSSTTEMIEQYPGICYAEIKVPYSYMPYLPFKHRSGRLLFSYGTFSGWYTNQELKIAMDYGCEVNPGEMIFYHNLVRPFRDVVKYLYKLRKEYKLQKHEFQAMVKVLMNSGLFGKWGTNPNNMEELIPLNKITFINGVPYYKKKLITAAKFYDNNNMFGGFITRKKQCKPFRYSFPIFSEYTTALGRSKLMNDIIPVSDHVVYTDTDSVVLTKKVIQEGNELGDWELEYMLRSGTFIRSKLYMINPVGKDYVCKSKGIGKYMKTKDMFVDALNKGSVHMERFSKMKESNMLGIKSGSVMKIQKHVGLEDDKRNWLGKRFSVNDWQVSEPWKVNDGYLPKEINDMNRKAQEAHDREQEKMMKQYLDSDVFDSDAVGQDISKLEFLRNEQWFAVHE